MLFTYDDADLWCELSWVDDESWCEPSQVDNEWVVWTFLGWRWILVWTFSGWQWTGCPWWYCLKKDYTQGCCFRWIELPRRCNIYMYVLGHSTWTLCVAMKFWLVRPCLVSPHTNTPFSQVSLHCTHTQRLHLHDKHTQIKITSLEFPKHSMPWFSNTNQFIPTSLPWSYC